MESACARMSFSSPQVQKPVAIQLHVYNSAHVHACIYVLTDNAAQFAMLACSKPGKSQLMGDWQIIQGCWLGSRPQPMPCCTLQTGQGVRVMVLTLSAQVRCRAS